MATLVQEGSDLPTVHVCDLLKAPELLVGKSVPELYLDKSWRNDVECPDWIVEKLSCPPETVASYEVQQDSVPYSALVQYLGRVAVDADGEPPKEVDAAVLEPESPGHLRALGITVTRSLDRTEPHSADFLIGLGYMRLRCGGADVFVRHSASARPVGSRFAARPGSKSSLIFRTVAMFAASADTLKQVMKDVVEWQFEYNKALRCPQEGKYILYSLVLAHCNCVGWRRLGIKAARPLDTVFLADGQKEAILADFARFRDPATKKWYMAHGVPYRRNYLFHGPPGVGKTSIIRALAGEFKVTACFMSLDDPRMGNVKLRMALQQLPRPGIIVIEDIDVLFDENRKKKTVSPLTFSGVLNALDGLVSVEGVLTIMTTNHEERLDKALTRSGRVDRRFQFGLPGRKQIADLFSSYYPESGVEMRKKFSDIVFEREEPEACSISILQQLFIHCRDDSAEECMAKVEEFFEDVFPKKHKETDTRVFN